MIDLHVEVTGADDVRSALSGLTDQIPYATSLAINNTLNDIQSAVRNHVHGAFIVRSAEFIDRSIYIGPKDRARKDNLVGTVRINPDRDVLAKFEDGGTKAPLSAKSLAVPVFRQNAPAYIITRGDPLNVKLLIQSIIDKGGRLRRRRGRNALPPQLARQTVFMVHGRDGHTYLVERTGTSGSATRVLYAFKQSVPIKPLLEFGEISMATALDRWQANAGAAIEQAIATMR